MRLIVALALILFPTAAQDNTLTRQQTEAGWRLLFDGKSMRGWQDPAKKTVPGSAWTIENGYALGVYTEATQAAAS